MNNYYVYILKCRDNTLYTGITTDLEQRLTKHNQGTGAKYTRGRTPVELVYYENGYTKSEALKREIAIKKLTRTKKEKLINSFNNTKN